MRRRVLGAALGSALAIGIFACTPARPGGDSAPDAFSSVRAGRALVMAIRYEPTSLATRELDSVSVGQYTTKRAFNAQLAILDERGVPRPYLAETLPQLNTESWHVFPDGRMETTYH